MKILSVMLVMFVLLLAACKAPAVVPSTPIGDVVFEGSCPTDGSSDDPNCLVPTKQPIVTEINVTPGIEINEPKDVSYTINGIEGDLLAIKPNAYSPDGAKLTFSFSRPFNENGLWQTKDSDAGKYLITVTASDGVLSTSESVLVKVTPSNKAPSVECPETVVVQEGEEVNVDCNIIDIDGDDMIVGYSGWMDSSRYLTTYSDAGEYTVIVRAADPEHVTTKTVAVFVENVNRAPSFDTEFEDITASETDVITIDAVATDVDGDDVTVTYSSSFNAEGIWKTGIGNAGTYPVTVVASDGALSTKAEFTLRVNPVNTAPVLKPIADVTVYESETVRIPVEATDREGDPLVVSFSGFMSKDTYVTTFDDAYPKGCGVRGCTATYLVTVSVTDGSLITSQDVTVNVIDKHRAPVFIKP